MKLGKQFHYTRDPFTMKGGSYEDKVYDSKGGQTTENFIGDRTTTTYRTMKGDDQHAYMNVIHHGGESKTWYPNSVEGYNEDWTFANEDTGPQQGKLFKRTETPAHSKVDMIASTKESRVPAMTMLGIAQQDTLREHGRGLEASRNLSKHSNRMVRHLAERGATDAPAPVSNSQQFLNGPSRVAMDYERVSPEDQASGKSLLRSVLGKNKGGRESSEQLEFFR